MDIEAPAAKRFYSTIRASYGLKGFWKGYILENFIYPYGFFRSGISFVAYSKPEYPQSEISASVFLLGNFERKDLEAKISSGNFYLSFEDTLKILCSDNLTVYLNGKWEGEDGPWRQIIVKTIEDLEKERNSLIESCELEKKQKFEKARKLFRETE